MKPRINFSLVRRRNVFLILFICLALTGLAWASAYSEAVIADSPLSYFQFEDAVSADGNSCADTMGLTTAVYRNRGTEKAPISLIASRPGLGQAAEFHGTESSNGNFVDVQDNGYSGDLLTDANMTIEMWMNTTADSSNYPTVVNYHDFSGGPTLSFGNYTGPPVETFQPFVSMADSTWYAWPPGILGDGDWHHYAVTFTYDSDANETTAEIWMDAESKGTHAFTGQIVPNTTDIWKDILLGAAGNPYYVYNGYVGLMDEVAIYDYALSEVQIGTHYNAEVNNVDAPAAPTGLGTTPGDGFVLLDWNDNNEPDVNGYNVYRSATSGSGYVRLNSGLLTSSDYNDSDVSIGTTYYYVVTAVDTNDYESDYSDEVSGIPADFATRTFVYKYKSTKWCYDYDSNDSNWVDSREREQGYFIIDVNYGLACQIDWDSGSLTYQRVYDGNFSTTMEQMNGQTTWLFSQFGNDYNDYSLVVQGNARTSTIAGTAVEVASSLKGTSINNFGSDPRYIEMGKANLKLDKTWTTLSIGNYWSCSQTEAAIVADLNDAGYTESTDLTELASDSNYYDLITPDVNVLVYNCSEKGMQYSDSGGPWLREKGNDKFFLVIDVNSGQYTRIDYDTRARTYEETTSGTYDVLGIQGVKSTLWVVLDLDSDSALALSGKAKTKKLGTQAVSVASKLKGYLTYNQGTSPQYIGDKTINCGLYKTLSIEAVEGSYTLSQAVDAVKTFLGNKGYTEL
jgi:hypothetical protein